MVCCGMLLVLLLALHYMCHTQHAPDAWPAATDQHGEGPGLRMHPVLGSGRETFLLCAAFNCVCSPPRSLLSANQIEHPTSVAGLPRLCAFHFEDVLPPARLGVGIV